jgi:hypothetical protein
VQYLLSIYGFGQIANHHHALLHGLICRKDHASLMGRWPLHTDSSATSSTSNMHIVHIDPCAVVENAAGCAGDTTGSTPHAGKCNSLTMEFCCASMAAAASSLAADSRASSGPSMSATSCAVEARPPAGTAAAPAAAASASALDSGGLKNTGNGDPPVGVPLISTVSYAPRPRHSV